MIDLATALQVDTSVPPSPMPVEYHKGDRVRIIIGKPGAWPRPGRVTGTWEDPEREGGIAVGVNFIEGRGALYFSTLELEHID